MDYLVVFGTLLLALGLFAWGRIRHDFVALISLFVLVIAGIVKPAEAFSGFGHPAVITVAAVLIIGKALELSGLIDVLGKWVTKVGSNLILQILVLSVLVAVASAFMNNVGALAIMMPIAIHMARQSGHSPSHVLMPIAFASLLGGMTTLIGTPPNIIIAAFRQDEMGQPFGMFDFSPVGVALTIAGLAFSVLLGWRMLPRRTTAKSSTDIFDIDHYMTEMQVKSGSKAEGRTILEFVAMTKADIQILGIVRDNTRIHAPEPTETLADGDVLIIEMDAEDMKTLIEDTEVSLVGNATCRDTAKGSSDIAVFEAVVMADSALHNRTVSDLDLRRRWRVNLLAVARRGEENHHRLADVTFRVGDVVLLQGREKMLQEAITALGCLPLAKRGLTLGYKTKIPLAVGIFGLSIAVVVAGWLPVEAAFSMAAVALVLTRVMPLKEVYHSVDWPVIVLLGAMIPVGVSLETTGGAQKIASVIMLLGEGIPGWALLAVILTVTMLLSGVINNAATVLLMAPIALGVARGLSYAVDPFLMAVAIGGSAAFLTPIGHQSNTLVMGPGGYRFTDYTRMGAPLTILMVVVGVPLILWVFPL